MEASERKDELAPVLNNVEGLPDFKEPGDGQYGVRYQVTVDGKLHIAKRLHEALAEGLDKQDINQKFHHECITLSRLRHPNIVSFVGVHYGSLQSELSLIMEHLPYDLSSFLESHPLFPLPIKLSILLDVASGLDYLHTNDPPVVHGELTAHNVLLSNDYRAKIADLGVAKLLTQQALLAVSEQRDAPGSSMYMPPEATDLSECTPKFDIFSFGNLSLVTINQEESDTPVQTERKAWFKRSGSKKHQPSLDKVGRDHCMYSLITKCLENDPSKRPNACELMTKLQELCTKHPEKIDKKEKLLVQELEMLYNKLDKVTRERNTLRRRLEETEREHKEQMAAVQQDNNKTLNKLQKKVKDLQDEVHLYNEQGNEYYEMITQYKDELSSSLERTELHQKQAQTFASETDSYMEKNKALLHELKELKASLEHTSAELQKEQGLRLKVEKQYQQLVQLCGNLEVQVTTLTGSHDTPPISALSDKPFPLATILGTDFPLSRAQSNPCLSVTQQSSEEEPTISRPHRQLTKALSTPPTPIKYSLNKQTSKDVLTAMYRYRASTVSELPYSPDFVCPVCEKTFRVGEAREFQAHVENCNKKLSIPLIQD